MAKRSGQEAPPRPSKAISPKDAVIAATKYFTDVTGNTSGVSVEEMELSEDGKYWLVTLGYVELKLTGLPLSLTRETKSYKSFKVNARTGDVLSMKIREI